MRWPGIIPFCIGFLTIGAAGSAHLLSFPLPGGGFEPVTTSIPLTAQAEAVSFFQDARSCKTPNSLKFTLGARLARIVDGSLYPHGAFS